MKGKFDERYFPLFMLKLVFNTKVLFSLGIKDVFLNIFVGLINKDLELKNQKKERVILVKWVESSLWGVLAQAIAVLQNQ